MVSIWSSWTMSIWDHSSRGALVSNLSIENSNSQWYLFEENLKLKNPILNGFYLKQLNHVYLGSFLKGSFSVKSVCIVRRQLWHFRKILDNFPLTPWGFTHFSFQQFRKTILQAGQFCILKLWFLFPKVFGHFVNYLISEEKF